MPATYTEKQGEYLFFIYQFTEKYGVSPAFTDFARRFLVTGPTVNQMVKRLEERGFIEKVPGLARSIRLLVHPDDLPGGKGRDGLRLRTNLSLPWPRIRRELGARCKKEDLLDLLEGACGMLTEEQVRTLLAAKIDLGSHG